MIKIIAILEESGRAFVEEENAKYHIQPPFLLDNKTVVCQKDIDIATNGYGFKNCSLAFNSYGEVKKYLLEKYSLFRSEVKIPELSGEEVLIRTPLPILTPYIKKLEEDYSQKRYRFVVSVGSILLKNKYLNNKSDDWNKIDSMVKNADHEIDNYIEARSSSIFINIHGDNTYKKEHKYSKLARRIELVIQD